MLPTSKGRRRPQHPRTTFTIDPRSPSWLHLRDETGRIVCGRHGSRRVLVAKFGLDLAWNDGQAIPVAVFDNAGKSRSDGREGVPSHLQGWEYADGDRPVVEAWEARTRLECSVCKRLNPSSPSARVVTDSYVARRVIESNSLVLVMRAARHDPRRL